MDNCNEALETQKENVKKYSMLLRAFIPLIPQEDRTNAYKWLTKLRITEGCNIYQLKNKAEYLWYFIKYQAQGHGMLPLFQLPPPYGELPLLSELLTKELYAEVVSRKDCWKVKQSREGPENHELEDADEHKVFYPSDFVMNQPFPSSGGAYIYACVFAPKEI